MNYETVVLARGRIRREGGSEDLIPYSIGHYLGMLYKRANVDVECFTQNESHNNTLEFGTFLYEHHLEMYTNRSNVT